MNEEDIVQAILVPDLRDTITESWAIYSAVRACLKSFLMRQGDPEMWDRWLAGSFTKSVRRYPVNKVYEFAELPYVELHKVITSDDSIHLIYVLPPMRYKDMPKIARNCQVSNTNFLDKDENWPTIKRWDIDRNYNSFWGFHLNPHLDMTSGKKIAQVCHGVIAQWMLVQGREMIYDPILQFPRKIVFRHVYITNNVGIYDSIESDFVIRDAGFTEVEPGSITVKIALSVPDQEDPF